MDKSKPFGLIIPKKAKTFPVKTSAIFDSDSDDEPKRKMPKIPQKPLSKKLIETKKSEDPSIYEYDSIYDDMKAQEKAKIAAPKDANKPSRYIDSLLKAADKRKKNLERRVEKKVQSEREKEGEKFKDKESFVTSAYKKKMQEMEEEEERERRENELNDMMDVTKQKDLSGFYRHFLKQSIGEEKIPVFGERSIKKEPDAESPKAQDSIKKESDAESSKSQDSIQKEPEPPKSQDNDVEGEKLDPNLDRDSDISLSSSEDEKDPKDAADDKKPQTGSDDEDERNKEPKSKKRKIHRQIRKRFDEGSEDEAVEEREDERKKTTKSKHDRGSSRRSGKHKRDEKKRKSSESSKSESDSEDENDCSKLNDLAETEKHPDKDGETKVEEKKPKRNIYEKRTVGTVFTDAQARYFQRMSARSG